MLGLSAALDNQLGHQFDRLVDGGAVGDVDGGSAAAVFFIERSALVVTEVVSNSVKHAGLTAAQRIDLNITVLPECLRIEVTDDGAGFDPVVTRPDPSQRSGGWVCGWWTN